MIKKAGHIILGLLLLFTTTGITISKHYCGNNLKSVTFMTEPVSCCDEDGCCHNDYETYLLDDDFAPVAFAYDFERVSIITPPFFSGIQLDFPEYLNFEVYSDDPSPPELRSFLACIQTFIL
jgi:hypothetical protein